MSTPLSERRLLQNILDDQRVTNRDDVIYEIHYRVPRWMSAPFMATHFVQIHQSAEDRYFDRAVEEVRRVFSSKTQPAASLFPARDYWLALPDNKRPAGDRELFADAAVARVDRVRNWYTKVLERSPALFVFGSQDHILDWIARRVTDEFGSDATLNLVLKNFCASFPNAHTQLMRGIFPGFRPETYDAGYDSGDFGSVRWWLEDRGYLKRDQGSPPNEPQTAGESGPSFDDFVHYEVIPPDEVVRQSYRSSRGARAIVHDQPPLMQPPTQLELRWGRYPQSWSYTFIESIPVQSDPNNLRAPRWPSRDQWQSSDERKSLITGFLLTAVLDPSVVNSTGLPPVDPNRVFPGKTLAGAHYVLVRVDDLLAFSLATPKVLGLGTSGFDHREISRAVLRFRHPRPPEKREQSGLSLSKAELMANLMGDFQEARQESIRLLLTACFKLLSRLPGALTSLLDERQSLDAAPMGSWTSVRATLQNLASPDDAARVARDLVDVLKSDVALLFPGTVPLPKGTAPLPDVPGRSLLGDVVRAVVTSTSISGDDKGVVFRRLADVTKAFWNSTIRVALPPERLAEVVRDDFVSSAMSEGRCIYFSNFLPFGEEKYTRTIFVDVDMEMHQRARMLQRLTDILSYRSIPLRDLGRVRAATEALNDLNRDLNNIQMRITGLHGPRDGSDDDHGSELEKQQRRAEHMKKVQDQLGDTLEVSAKLGRLNAFFTYGIAGKSSSTSAYYDQIHERCDDVREQRILGYPRLTDFVRRRLKHSVRYIERMHVHYSTVGGRITEVLDRVRTQFDSLQTEHAAELTRQTAKQTEQMATLMDQQLSLTQAAEIVVLAAGLYYVFSLGKAATEITALLLVGGAFVLLVLHPNYREIFKRSVLDKLKRLLRVGGPGSSKTKE